MWCRRRESNDTPLLITRNLLKKHDRSKRNNRPMSHSDVQNHVQRNRSLRRCSSTQVLRRLRKTSKSVFQISLFKVAPGDEGAAEAWERLRGRPRGVRSAARGGGSDAARPGCVRQPSGRRRGRCHEDCRAWRALDAVGAMDAENAPTAPWKSLRDFHKRLPPSLLAITLRTDKRRRACAQLGLTRFTNQVPVPQRSF